MSRVNCITINTDASFNFDHKVGGYAFYIICDYFKIQKGGYFKGAVRDSMDAEMACMANAIHTLINQPALPKCTLIILNTDRLDSIPFIEKTKKKKALKGRPVAEIVSEYLERLKDKTGGRVEIRHVKAHNGTPDARSFVNNWCDKEAKKWMRLAVKNIQK